jgi:hypothetical protein
VTGLEALAAIARGRRPTPPPVGKPGTFKRFDGDWTNADLRALAALAKRLRMNPADLLLVLTAESLLDPRSTNPYGAYGLNQLTKAAAGLVGYAPDRISEVASLPVSRQLPLVERYFAGLGWTKAGKTWPHAPAVYEGNFAPARMLSRGTSMGVVLYSRDAEPGAYKANYQLDVDNKGTITVGDLARRLRSLEGSGIYRHGLGRLRVATGTSVSPRLG